MTADLRAIRGWKTWRYATSEDGATPGVEKFKTDAEGNVTSFLAGVNIHPYSAIAIRMFGSNADNDTAFMQLTAAMDDQRKTGTGPGQELWAGQVTLGSVAATPSTGRPLNDGQWPVGTLLEVDTYDSAVASGSNAANAVVLNGANQAMLILPTLGYAMIDMRLYTFDGTGTEMSTLGAIYREIALGGVV